MEHDLQSGTCLVLLRLPVHHEIAIRDDFAVLQLGPNAIAFSLHAEPMRAALHRTRPPQAQIKRETVAGIPKEKQRLSTSVSRCDLVATHVAGRSGQRHPQRPPRPLHPGELNVGRLHSDFLIGLDSRDLQREHIGRLTSD